MVTIEDGRVIGRDRVMSHAAPRCSLLQSTLIRSLGRVNVKTGSRPEAKVG